MKKISFYILIILILIIFIIIGSKNYNQTSSLRMDARNFSVSDTNLITKITLKNRSLEYIELSRTGDNWMLNDSLIANQSLINIVLKTIKEMRIKSPIARAALPNVIKRMAIQNTELNIFKKNKKIKTIYIGGETPDQLGTFMMIHGAKEPYIMHIPGFNGYLSSRFSCNENIWKSKRIFKQQITHAEYTFKNIANYIEINNLSELKKVYCESFLTDNKSFKINNIITRKPFLKLKTIDSEGSVSILYCIRKKPVNKEKYKDHKYDRERFYGFMNNSLMLIQYQQFENFIQKETITDQFMPWKNLNSF